MCDAGGGTVGVGFGRISISISVVFVPYPFLLSSLLVLFCGMSSDSPILTLGCSATDPYHQQHHFESVRSIESKGRVCERDWVQRARARQEEAEWET